MNVIGLLRRLVDSYDAEDVFLSHVMLVSKASPTSNWWPSCNHLYGDKQTLFCPLSTCNKLQGAECMLLVIMWALRCCIVCPVSNDYSTVACVFSNPYIASISSSYPPPSPQCEGFKRRRCPSVCLSVCLFVRLSPSVCRALPQQRSSSSGREQPQRCWASHASTRHTDGGERLSRRPFALVCYYR